MGTCGESMIQITHFSMKVILSKKIWISGFNPLEATIKNFDSEDLKIVLRVTCLLLLGV